jgi:hypothetical protein
MDKCMGKSQSAERHRWIIRHFIATLSPRNAVISQRTAMNMSASRIA